MRDYSPLFNQGLFSIVATPAVTTHFRKPAAIVPLVVLPPQPRHENSVQARRSRRIANGRSFLHLNKTSVNTDEDSFKVPSIPRTATGVTFQSSRRASSSSSASPTSPSRRALPLAKPAPLSSLPAIPISTAPTTSTSAPSSPVASSAALAPSASSSSSAARKKHASLAPSFFSTRTHLRSDSVLSGFLMDMTASPSGSSTPAAKEEKESSVRSVSTAYRKRRRQDALQALEGRGSRGTSSRRRDRAPSTSHPHHHHHHITSFMPSILHEVEVEEAEDPMKLLLEDAVAGYAASSFRSPTTKHHLYRSHLSFGSAAVPHAFAVKPQSRDSNAIFSAASSVAPKTRRSSNGMLMMSPTTPCFSVSYPGEDSLSALSGPPRRASSATGSGASKGCGWGMNFIDLVDDDAASSIWRWSHVA